MDSPLPGLVQDRLVEFVQGVDEAMQVSAHRVETALAVTPAFDKRDIDSRLVRANLCHAAVGLAGEGLEVVELAMGGCEARIVEDGRCYRFRWARAKLDPRRGSLVVRVNSDSALTHRVKAATLFEDSETIVLADDEFWLLVYLVHPLTRTFNRVVVGLPVAVQGRSPHRVVFGTRFDVPLEPHTPPDFGARDDDLDLGDEDDLGEEVG